MLSLVQAVSTSNGPWGCSWYAKSGLYIFLNRSGRCAAACDADILWSPKDKRLAEAWMAVFATVCLVSVAIAILTLLKPRKRPILTSTAGKNLLQSARKKRIISTYDYEEINSNVILRVNFESTNSISRTRNIIPYPNLRSFDCE